jgi:hypothetical protein
MKEVEVERKKEEDEGNCKTHWAAVDRGQIL